MRGMYIFVVISLMLICSSVGNIMSHSNNQEWQRYTSMLHLLVPTFCIIQIYKYIWILKSKLHFHGKTYWERVGTSYGPLEPVRAKLFQWKIYVYVRMMTNFRDNKHLILKLQSCCPRWLSILFDILKPLKPLLEKYCLKVLPIKCVIHLQLVNFLFFQICKCSEFCHFDWICQVMSVSKIFLTTLLFQFIRRALFFWVFF